MTEQDKSRGQKGEHFGQILLEEAISSGELDLDALLDLIPAVILLIDAGDFSIQRINRAGMDTLGLDHKAASDHDRMKVSDLISQVDFPEGLHDLVAMKGGIDGRYWTDLVQMRIRGRDELVFCAVRRFNPANRLLWMCVPISHEPDKSAGLSRLLAESAFRARNAERFGSLTERERQVMSLVAKGVSTREIARRLHISENTVKSHRKSVNGKLGINNSGDLLRYAVAFDLIKFDD